MQDRSTGTAMRGHAMRRLAAAATLMLFTTAQGASAAPPMRPCQGTWSELAGLVIGHSGGRTVPVRKGGYEEDIFMQVQLCGVELHIRADGRDMALHRDKRNPALYRGSVSFGGVHRLYRFELITPRLMQGGVEAMGSRLTVQKPMTLVYESNSAKQPPCPHWQTPSTDPEAISAGQATATVKAAMRARGLVPPQGMSYSDFLYSYRAVGSKSRKPDGERMVRLLLAKDGRILPNSTQKRICSATKGDLEPARHWLEFELIPLPNGTSVTVRDVDLETGHIKHQRMGESGKGQLRQAVDKAWNKLQVKAGPMSDGHV